MKNIVKIPKINSIALIYCVLCFCIFFYSCNRKCTTGKETILKGQVIDNTTQLGVAGALVIVQGSNVDLNLASKEFGRTTTDGNGSFTIDCKDFKNYNMVISANRTNYIHLYNTEIDIEPCDKIHANLKLGLNPSAVIKVHAKNLYKIWDKLSLDGIFHIGQIDFSGYNMDTTIFGNYTGNVKGNANNNLKVVFSKFGKDSVVFQNIYSPAFDTTNVEILY